MDNLLQYILEARDKRAQLRGEITREGMASLSLSLNIPGIPKSTPLYVEFFHHVLGELTRFLNSYRVSCLNDRAICRTDGDGDFFLVPLPDPGMSIRSLKQLTEEFEISHPLGRLLDVDLVDAQGVPISSGKAKLCFFCNKQPAIVCMRSKSHSYKDIREKIDDQINHYLKQKKAERVCRRLSALALKSLLHEVSLTPKPGLVDRLDSGAHDDMDYTTFLNSSAVISTYFSDIARMGFNFQGDDLRMALPSLRQWGMRMEEDMFEETNGVNTHKGAIFLLGFSLFTAAHLMGKNGYNQDAFVKSIKYLNADLVAKELEGMHNLKPQTHGEECFRRFGERGLGIRGEIQKGLPTVFEHALPQLRDGFNCDNRQTDLLLQKVLTRALFSIMAVNDDSNILFRKGVDVLDHLKDLSVKALKETCEGNSDRHVITLHQFCHEMGISPGGSADLLAVSLFIYSVEREFPN